jgi:methyl coenzyme M reductase subunit D
MTSNFSVVIPTMWLSNKTPCLLTELDNSSLINEIILIDNNPEKITCNISKFKKVNHVKNKNNIFVNPSWNLGVQLCKNTNIIITNDDLCIENIDRVLREILNHDYDLIGLDYKNLNKNSEVSVKNKIGSMEKGFGCFFYIKKEKYIIIDNEIKIWYGDLILHNLIKNKGIISFNRIDIELSKTVKNTTNLTNILTKDKHVYETKYKN